MKIFAATGLKYEVSARVLRMVLVAKRSSVDSNTAFSNMISCLWPPCLVALCVTAERSP